MKKRYLNLAAAAGALAFSAMALVCSAPARAVDELARGAAAASHVRLPALTVGGVRRGDIIVITDNGMERVKYPVLAQRLMTKSPTRFEFCNLH